VIASLSFAFCSGFDVLRSGVGLAVGVRLASIVSGRVPFAVDSKNIIFFDYEISSSRLMSSSI